MNDFGKIAEMFPRLVSTVFTCLTLVVVARAEAPPMNRFEKEIVAYEAADKTNPPSQGAIVFTGASGIRRWDTLAQDFPALTVINRIFGVSQISDSIYVAYRIV